MGSLDKARCRFTTSVMKKTDTNRPISNIKATVLMSTGLYFLLRFSACC